MLKVNTISIYNLHMHYVYTINIDRSWCGPRLETTKALPNSYNSKSLVEDEIGNRLKALATARFPFYTFIQYKSYIQIIYKLR